MRKGKSVIGKQILSLADGARLQTVKDVILGANNERVVGLLADEGQQLGVEVSHHELDVLAHECSK